MKLTDLTVAEFNKTLKLAKSLLTIPGGDTTLTLTAVKKEKEGSHVVIHANSAGHRFASIMMANVEEEGTLHMELSHLAALSLNASKTFSIETLVEKGENKILIKNGRTKYRVLQVSCEDPPTNPFPIESEGHVQTSIDQIRKLLGLIWFDHENDLGDIRLTVKNGRAAMETSDRIKMAITKKAMPTWKDKNLKEYKVVLKKSTLDQILRGFDNNENVFMGLGESNFILHNDLGMISIPIVLETEMLDIEKTLKSILEGMKLQYTFSISSQEIKEISLAAAKVAGGNESLKNVCTNLKVNKEKSELSISTQGNIGSFSTSIKIKDVKTTKDFPKNGKMMVSLWTKHFKDLSSVASSSSQSLLFEVWGESLILLKSEGADHKTIYGFPQAESSSKEE